jgi:S-(hydroxymethyl)glutathione dehydrogenase / alcohol dehydrogenase
MPTIRAAVCHRFNDPLVIENVDLRPPIAGEVEVTLAAVAICHSDISFATGAWGGTLPAVYGHEAAGHVTTLGPGVSDFASGDAVLVTMVRACGTCHSCAQGRRVLCETPYDRDAGPLRTLAGGTLSHGLYVGAFAERVVVDQSQLVALPPAIPMDAACLLACGVLTGVGAVVNTGAVRAGESVVVIGTGGVGLNVIQGAYIAGAARIIAVDLTPGKLAAAAEFGATHGVLAGDPAPWDRVRALTQGRGADAVFVAVGALAAYDTAMHYVARGGRMVMVGMPHSGARASYEPGAVAFDGQVMRGSLLGDGVLRHDVAWMIDLYQQGRLKLDELISGRWSLDQINEAIADTLTGTARRNVILFN